MDEIEDDDGAEMLQFATNALQSTEKLIIKLNKNQAESHIKAFKKSQESMECLKVVKSQLEGSAVTFQPVSVQEKGEAFQKLKNIVLSHVPGSMNTEVQSSLKDLVINSFEGTCRKVIFAAMVTCPWYWATQDDRGRQAMHNSVFVVYINKDEQFFSPVNHHLKQGESEIIDKGWFHAVEIYHFAHYLVRGQVRFVELLFLPDAAIFHTEEEWSLLHRLVPRMKCLAVRGFVEQCRGQAVGSVAKKNKNTGQMRLKEGKDGATMTMFCDSFKLLHHATQVLNNKELHLKQINDSHLTTTTPRKALALLQQAYKSDISCKSELFEILMQWKVEIDDHLRGFNFPKTCSMEVDIGRWLASVRKGADFEPTPLSLLDSERQRLLTLMKTVGGPVSKMLPANILMVARAGSYMYGLATADSDTDYIVVYADPIESIISRTKKQDESVERRGKTLDHEYGAYEVRLFCEMVLKGSVVMLELLFANDLEYTSDPWKELVKHRELFLTERGILQYFGLIHNNMADIKHQKYKGDLRKQRKLFYQIFHKLDTLEYFARGQCPPVRCEEQVRQFIMKIREGDLQGDFHPDALYLRAEKAILSLRVRLSDRTRRLPELAHYDFLTQWLLRVRGWKT